MQIDRVGAFAIDLVLKKPFERSNIGAYWVESDSFGSTGSSILALTSLEVLSIPASHCAV